MRAKSTLAGLGGAGIDAGEPVALHGGSLVAPRQQPLHSDTKEGVFIFEITLAFRLNSFEVLSDSDAQSRYAHIPEM